MSKLNLKNANSLLRLLGLIAVISIIVIAGVHYYRSSDIFEDYTDENGEEYNKVAATFFPYYLLLKELKVSADIIVNPYTNPHIYTPSIQDYEKLKNAQYVVVDGFMDKELIKYLPSEKIIDPTPYRHGWLRFDTVYTLSKMLEERGIANVIPKELYELDKYYKGKFKNITAVTLHKGLEDALSYYGIDVVRALVAHDDETLSINDIEYLKNTDACIIIVTSWGQKKTLEQAGITQKVVYINVMGKALSKCYYSESYLATMKQNLKAIEDAAERCYNKSR